MDQNGLNDYFAKNPRVGDYWHERFCPVCVVCAVDDDSVTICRERVDVDDDKWVWDLNKKQKMSREEFVEFLSYDDKSGYWPDVNPERMKWVALSE